MSPSLHIAPTLRPCLCDFATLFVTLHTLLSSLRRPFAAKRHPARSQLNGARCLRYCSHETLFGSAPALAHMARVSDEGGPPAAAELHKVARLGHRHLRTRSLSTASHVAAHHLRAQSRNATKGAWRNLCAVCVAVCACVCAFVFVCVFLCVCARALSLFPFLSFSRSLQDLAAS
eukprot:3256239-Rhodomonas_salina.1